MTRKQDRVSDWMSEQRTRIALHAPLLASTSPPRARSMVPRKALVENDEDEEVQEESPVSETMQTHDPLCT